MKILFGTLVYIYLSHNSLITQIPFYFFVHLLITYTYISNPDIPDYRDKEILLAKLTYAVDHANTFEIV